MIPAAGLLILALAGCHARSDEKQLDEWQEFKAYQEWKKSQQ